MEALRKSDVMRLNGTKERQMDSFDKKPEVTSSAPSCCKLQLEGLINLVYESKLKEQNLIGLLLKRCSPSAGLIERFSLAG